MSWVCPVCGNSESADNVFCTLCGSRKPVASWTCTQCNTSGLSDEWEYCILCGTEGIKIVMEWIGKTIEKVKGFLETLAS